MGFRTDGPVSLRDEVSEIEPQIIVYDDDPSDGGFPAPIASLILANVAGEGRIYLKTAANDPDWTRILEQNTNIYLDNGEISGDRTVSAAVSGSGNLAFDGFRLISLISRAAPASGGGINIEWEGQSSIRLQEDRIDFLGDFRLGSYGVARNDTGSFPVEAFLYLNDDDTPGLAGNLKSLPREILFPTGTGTSPGFNGLWNGQLYVRYSSTPPEIYAWVNASTSWVLTN